MFYYRSKNDPHTARPISVRAARIFSAAALVSYPVGALLFGLSATLPAKIAGAALLVTALICAASLASTSVQRIVGEQPQYLDEFELQLRLKAMQSAYGAFTLLALLICLYSAIASDAGLWYPRDYEGYNGLFWGIFLYAWVLPTALVAFRMDADEEEKA